MSILIGVRLKITTELTTCGSSGDWGLARWCGSLIWLLMSLPGVVNALHIGIWFICIRTMNPVLELEGSFKVLIFLTVYIATKYQKHTDQPHKLLHFRIIGL